MRNRSTGWIIAGPGRPPARGADAMAVLPASLAPRGPEARANAEAMAALVADLRAQAERVRRGGGEAAQVDTGVRQGDAITPNHDPMIARLIVWMRTAPPRCAGSPRRWRSTRSPAGGQAHPFTHGDPLAPPRRDGAGSDRVAAPIPGRITRVLVSPGDAVARNAPLLVIEAMRMELTLRAPADGVVTAMPHRVDDMVEEGTELVVLKAEG